MAEPSPTSLVTPAIASIQPYIPGKPVEEIERELGIHDSVKLASNENPCGPSPKAIAAAHAALAKVSFYPEGDSPNLKERLAQFLGVPRSHLIVGNGSNEVIELLIRTFTTPAHHAVISAHAFLVYPLVLTAGSVPFTAVPMTADMRHDLVAMKAAIRPETRLLFVANPNNPTGTYNTRAELVDLLRGLPDHVIVALDEAYCEYAGAPDYTTGLELRDLHKNIIVLRTFSKCYGLAGLRIGYGVTQPELVAFMDRVRQPFNVSRVAQAAALAALDDQAFVQHSVALNAQGRDELSAALRERGLTVLPSQTNFILFGLGRSGGEVSQALLRHGVIVRPMAAYGLPEHIRVTVGLPEQNQRFLRALDAVLAT